MLLHNIGKVVWGVAGWSMPSLGLIPYFVAAGTVVLSIATSLAYFKGAEGKAAAIATEKAACEIRVKEGEAASAQVMSDLLSSIRTGDAAEPKTPAEEIAACKKSKLCRSKP